MGLKLELGQVSMSLYGFTNLDPVWLYGAEPKHGPLFHSLKHAYLSSESKFFPDM